ncbi:MAG TPA: dihydroneopterin aldolase [Gammaproteobacteria bacterium]|jgi:7,8-dihydroneopterin aldolase/epimerase/oxygenase|nr:dihydroneopterin aldolase [Pseudomonadota bacterium]HAY45635.1 dihydroneopterin aldolase [Gammaproteobacteria bacterium]
MDRIGIEGIQVSCVIGTHEWERKLKQKLTIDLVLELDLSVVGESDNLGDSIDYAAVVDAVTGLAIESTFRLIEALAEAIAALILMEFSIATAEVTVNKGAAVPGTRNVSVSIRRSSN